MTIKNTVPIYKTENDRQDKLRETYLIVFRKVNKIHGGIVLQKK